MTPEQLEALREWVRAEIEYGIASREEGSDGYRQSAHGERDAAERLFSEFAAAVRTLETSSATQEEK